jgi:hypothetical protein
MAEHNITPPPELVQQWVAEIWHEGTPVRVALSDEHIATRAAAWGADQELEACCEWTQGYAECGDSLRVARRPKPPSLKKQALELARPAGIAGAYVTFGPEELELIRRALQQLDD